MGLKLFIDFEGAVAHGNVARDLFLKFGGMRSAELFEDYEAGRLSAVGCLQQQAENLGVLSTHEVDQFFRSQPLDPYFRDLLLFCRSHGIEVVVISDGIDYAVRKILEAHEIDDLLFFANRAEFVPDRAGHNLTLRFPFADAECTRCTCCKRNIMLTRSGETDIVAFVGGEYSDACPARYADLVFAKDHFQTACQRENISYFPYSMLLEVIDRLRSVLGTGKGPRRRRRAEMKRREAFICE